MPPPAIDSKPDFLVLGAGIAGAAAARALAERGCSVQVLDKSLPCSGASANPAAVVRPVLARNPNDQLARFYSAAFDRSRSKISELLEHGHAIACEFNGVLHCHPEAASLSGESPHHYLNLAEARRSIGSGAQAEGVFLEQAGWVSPIDYCRALLAHELITLSTGECMSLHHDGTHWQLSLSDASSPTSAAHVVLANGYQLSQWDITAAMPIHAVASQLMHFVDEHETAGPRVPVVGAATLCPTPQGWLATAGHWPNLQPNNHGSLRNAHIVERCAAQWWMPKDLSQAMTRTAVRAASRDHLPVVGGVPDLKAATEIYADLRHGRPAHQYPPTPYHPNIYLLGALGGRGITSAQLCADSLIASVFGEPHPWKLALHPLRFLIRDLKRGVI